MELLSRKRRSGELSFVTEIVLSCSVFWFPYWYHGGVAVPCRMEVNLRVPHSSGYVVRKVPYSQQYFSNP